MGFLPTGRGGGVQRDTLVNGLAGADGTGCAGNDEAPSSPANSADADAARAARNERGGDDRIGRGIGTWDGLVVRSTEPQLGR
jgi:hypothetical protein